MDTNRKASTVSNMGEAKRKVERRQRRSFTDEYKAETVKLVLSGHKTAGQVARDLDFRSVYVLHADPVGALK